MSPKYLPPFCSIYFTIKEQMRFEDFQDGHLGAPLWYRTRTISAILNLYVALMPPIKFRLNPHYSLGGDVIWRIWRWPWQPSLMSEWNEFSSSESPCLPKASHQVSAQSDLPFWSRCHFKIFKMATMFWSWCHFEIFKMVAILDIGMERI